MTTPDSPDRMTAEVILADLSSLNTDYATTLDLSQKATFASSEAIKLVALDAAGNDSDMAAASVAAMRLKHQTSEAETLLETRRRSVAQQYVGLKLKVNPFKDSDAIVRYIPIDPDFHVDTDPTMHDTTADTVEHKAIAGIVSDVLRDGSLQLMPNIIFRDRLLVWLWRVYPFDENNNAQVELKVVDSLPKQSMIRMLLGR